MILIDAPGIPLIYSEDYSQKTLDTYVGYYAAIDIGRQRRDELGHEVWNRTLLHGTDLREFRKSEINRDFLVPNGIMDSMGITVELSDPTKHATIFLHGSTAGTEAFGERGLALLRLLAPAFKAGVRDLLQNSRQRASLAAHLDSLTEGMRIYDLDGKIVHQNPAFAAAIQGDHSTQKIQKGIEEVIQPLVMFGHERQDNPAALAGRRVSLEVHTHYASYDVRGYFMGAGLFDSNPRIAVTIQKLPPSTVLSDRGLHERFGLTTRELEITRRLAQGQSTKEIASACGISLHTARRHTEKIFSKLGVRNRSQIGPRLRSG
jgi:DNA-binding CsgD family transcriptional regulator